MPSTRPGEIDLHAIAGNALGHQPSDDREHVMKCTACGQCYDMRDLGEVLHHNRSRHRAPPRQ